MNKMLASNPEIIKCPLGHEATERRIRPGSADWVYLLMTHKPGLVEPYVCLECGIMFVSKRNRE